MRRLVFLIALAFLVSFSQGKAQECILLSASVGTNSDGPSDWDCSTAAGVSVPDDFTGGNTGTAVIPSGTYLKVESC